MGKKPTVLDANGDCTEWKTTWDLDFRGGWIGLGWSWAGTLAGTRAKVAIINPRQEQIYKHSPAKTISASGSTTPSFHFLYHQFSGCPCVLIRPLLSAHPHPLAGRSSFSRPQAGCLLSLIGQRRHEFPSCEF